MPGPSLKIKSVIGFNGKVTNGLHYTPCGGYIVYPLGSFVVLKNLKTDKESFLEGHTREISCLTISSDGSLVASGQTSLMGVKADVIVWDLVSAIRKLDAGEVMQGDAVLIHRLRQHLGHVRCVDFSYKGDFLATMGGQDDNAILVWSMRTGSAVCGGSAGSDSGYVVKWLNNRNDRFVSAGNFHVRVWQIDFSLPKLHAVDVKLGSARRLIQSVAIDNTDTYAYCGTSTGDILKIAIDRDEIRGFNEPDTKIPQMVGIGKDRYAGGLLAMVCVTNPSTGNSNLLIGAGDGTILYVNPSLKTVHGLKTVLMGGITSLSLHPSGQRILAGTAQCNRYDVSIDLAEADMKASCHFGAVNDVTFPEGCPDLVVTSSSGDVRIWNVRARQELLRIQVPNLECLCTGITGSGSTLVTGWDDGKIRAFFPESGRMKFVIADAHSDKVSALAIADDDRGTWRIISGGGEGRVRIWEVTHSHRALITSLKEHRGPVNSIKVNKSSTQAISASSDGSCIVWDLERYVRIVAFFDPNVFTAVLYHPDESQMLTCGSNHKITYWDAVDGQAIRVIDGSETAAMTSLDVEPSGEFFVSGSQDRSLKVWHYDEGLPMAVGHGHSGSITAVKISPDRRTIVSTGSTGEIIFWEMPPLEEMRLLAEH